MRTEPIRVEEVLTAYSGLTNSCYCGCSGKYYYTESTRKVAGKDRGYEVDDDEINEKMVLKIVNRVNASIGADAVYMEALGSDIYTVKISSKRSYTVYLKK